MEWNVLEARETASGDASVNVGRRRGGRELISNPLATSLQPKSRLQMAQSSTNS